MRKPRGAEPKAAKMPSCAVSLWPKMNVYCYKLRFWGDNCSALLWPEITDEASAILVMLSSTLSPVTLSRLPGEGDICISVSPGYAQMESLPLPWVLWVQPLSEAADSLHSHSELDNHIQCWSTLCKVFSLPFLLCLANVSHLAFCSRVSLSELSLCTCACCHCLATRWIKEWLRLIHWSLLL